MNKLKSIASACNDNNMESTFNASNDIPSNISSKKMTLNLTIPQEEIDSVRKDNVLRGFEQQIKPIPKDEDPEASRPIASIVRPNSKPTKVDLQDSPVPSRGRLNSIMTEDFAQKDNESTAAETLHPFVTGSTDDTQRVKRNKKKKASQRMRPKSHSPLRTAAENIGKPLMDLRLILKKHEKKSATQQMYDGDDSQSSDFYGSLSSIPFLHPDKEEKKPRKGKRTKKKGLSLPTKSSDRKMTTDEPARKGHSKITVTKEYTDADVQLWKSMSALDGSYMEEVSQRPDIMFPVTDPSSPQKEKKAPESSTKHNERGFHRPDDWVECDHPTKRNPKKKTYHSKNELECVNSDPPAESEPIEIPMKEAHTAVETVSIGENKPQNFEPVQDSAQDLKKDGSKINTSESLTTTLTTPARQKKHKKTSLAITFQDGYVISGDFRPKERVERVIRDLQQDLLRSDLSLPDIELFLRNSEKGEKECLDPQATLREVGLVPSGEVFVHWKGPVDEFMSPGWYLNSGD